MATLEELSSALRNADAAGDTSAATMLAGEIVKMQKQPKASGSFLPVSKGQDGKISFDSNAGILGSIKSAFTLPGDVAAGRVDPREEPGRVFELATLGSPVNPAIRAGDQLIAGAAKSLKPLKPAVPTTQELMDTAAGDFNKFRQSSWETTPQAVAEFSRGAQQKLWDEKGISDTDAGATFAKLRRIENAPPEAVAVTAPNIKSLRESLGHTAQNFNPQFAKDQLAASRVINNLDDFVRANDAPSGVAGAAAPSQIYDRARGNAAAAYRSNEINGDLDRATTGLLERSEGRAQAANSGRNIDNTIRQKTASILERPKDISGLSSEEIAALEKVRDGGAGRNTARYIGNLLGGGGGLGQSLMLALGGLGGGAAVGGPVGAAVGASLPVAGALSRGAANQLAKKDLRLVDEMMRKRSPMYEDRVANPQMVPQNAETRAALIRALMLQQQQ
jgi:hypothetical protein